MDEAPGREALDTRAELGAAELEDGVYVPVARQGIYILFLAAQVRGEVDQFFSSSFAIRKPALLAWSSTHTAFERSSKGTGM